MQFYAGKRYTRNPKTISIFTLPNDKSIIMRRNLFWACLLPVLISYTTSGAAPRDKGETAQSYVDYFSRYLAGDKTACTANARLTNKAVGEVRETVWNAWKRANAAFEEEKLGPVDTLSKSRSGSWDLTRYEPNAVMPYYYGSKGSEKPDAGWPLFLYLHGSGAKAREWSNGFRLCSAFDDAPSAFFIPQIPQEGSYYRWWQLSKQHAWEKLLRQAFVSDEIDPNRVYFFGISEGAYGSQRLASFYADYLAAAGPIAGGEPLQNAPVENCANLAFSLRTGDKDTGFSRNVLTANTKTEFDSLSALHPGYYRHNTQVVPDATHTSIDYRPTTPWMKGYTRNPYPKYVYWENFEMDGRYRDGFYNLFVKERSNDDNASRSCYEMTIEGNEIDLKVNTVTYKVTERDRIGIPLRFHKTYTPATKGRVVIYLNDQLVNLKRPVTVTVNGRRAFKGKVRLDAANLMNSCAAFFDPERIYPAAVEVEVQ